MPAALYRLLRSTSVNPPDPLIITTPSTFQTSRQIAEYLLCVDCEDRFRRNGEDWVLRHCYRGKQKFLLRDLVLKDELLNDGAAGKIYATKSISDIDSSALTYFAASVVWRAAAHNWQFLRHIPGNPISLGPYEEPIRKYLLGDGAFPHSAAMLVWISAYDRPSRAVTPPQSNRIWNCHVHAFDIPGVRFNLFVGRTLPPVVRLMCVLNGPDRPVLVSHAPDDILATNISRLSQTTRLSAALQREGKFAWR